MYKILIDTCDSSCVTCTFVRDDLLELINLERFGCREFEPYNICQICVTLRYVLNFSVWNIFINEEKITDSGCHVFDLDSFF